MPREVTDAEGVVWSCAQAFAGLNDDPERAEAARVKGAEDLFHVVCTPSGGARSVRLQLPSGWEEMPEEALAREIGSRRDGDEREG